MKTSGYSLPVSPLIVFTDLLALLFSLFGVYSTCTAAIAATVCQSSEAHPDANRRWLAAAITGVFYILAEVFGGSATRLVATLPVSRTQMLTGLVLFGTISGNLFQALHNRAECDAAIVAFLVTASGLTVFDVGFVFWGLAIGGICCSVLTLLRCTQLRWRLTRRLFKPVTEMARRTEPIGYCNTRQAA